MQASTGCSPSYLNDPSAKEIEYTLANAGLQIYQGIGNEICKIAHRAFSDPAVPYHVRSELYNFAVFPQKNKVILFLNHPHFIENRSIDSGEGHIGNAAEKQPDGRAEEMSRHGEKEESLTLENSEKNSPVGSDLENSNDWETKAMTEELLSSDEEEEQEVSRSKSFSSAVKFTFLEPGSIPNMSFLARLKNKVDSDEPNFILSNINNIQREIRFLQELKGCPDVAQIDCAYRYEGSRKLDQEPVPKIAFYQELCEEGNLQDYINCYRGRDYFNQFEAIPLFFTLVRGLRDIHRAGIVHNDLKPSNIFLTLGPMGQSNANILRGKYGDFDLSYYQKEEALIEAGNLFGISPEKFRVFFESQASLPKDGFAMDVWALGVIFYEMYIGEIFYYDEMGEAIALKGELIKILEKLKQTPSEDPLTKTLEIEADKLRGQLHVAYSAALEKMNWMSKQPRPKNPFILQLIWDMLQFEPEKRMTIEQLFNKFCIFLEHHHLSPDMI